MALTSDIVPSSNTDVASGVLSDLVMLVGEHQSETECVLCSFAAGFYSG